MILVDFDAEGFTVTPLADGANATPHTVSAHMLYENSDPFILYEPGGHLDVTGAAYAAVDGRSVRVKGSEWVPADRYTVKLEGARRAGYQSVLLTLLRDRRYVENVDAWCADILARCRAKAETRLGLGPEDFDLELRVIGRNATLGALENRANGAVELGVLGIVTASTAQRVDEVAKMLNPYLLHHPLTADEE